MATTIEVSEEDGVRYLHFGSRWIQGAMRIARPWALELEYTQEMMLSLLLRPSERWPKSVLMIGLGAASLPKFLYRHRPRAQLTVVEIDPVVVNVARQSFKLPDDPKRLSIVIADGYEYVLESDRQFDLILVDGYDAKCSVGMLDTLPFHCNCRARLSDRGLEVVNFLNRRRWLAKSVERISDAFDGRACALPVGESGNVVAVAAVGERVDVSLADLRSGALKMKRETGLNLLPLVSRLFRLQAGISDRFAL